MKKIFTLIIILVINISALSAKEKTKKINSDICEGAIKNAIILGYTGSGDYKY
jgi:hypothetical protein